MSFSAGYVVLSNAQAVAAGTPAASTNSVNITSGSGGVISGTITNGSTAPTASCLVELQASGDGGATWYTINQFTAGIQASIAYKFTFDIPEVVTDVRLYYSGNTGSGVTAQAAAFYAQSL